MITYMDIHRYAARTHGVSLPLSVCKEALALVNVEEIEQAERARWTAVMWDGGDHPDGRDARKRWTQLSDAQLTKWDSMTTQERQAWLPRAATLMTKHAQGQLSEKEMDEVATMPVPKDAHGVATLNAFAQGKCVYTLLRDGKLHHYQPYVAHERGGISLELDESHPYHWKKAADRHRDIEMDSMVSSAVMPIAMEHALEIAESRGVVVPATMER